MANRGLGRGFDSLIPTDIVEDDFDITASQDAKESKLVELKLDNARRRTTTKRFF